VAEFDRDEFELKIIATEKALHFIRSQDFKCEINILSDTDEWQWSKRGDPVLHIRLRDWADLCLVAPLSANSLAKAANGICDNLVLCVLRAWDFSKPVVVAPAMNTAMWKHPVTKEHLEKVERWGYKIIQPIAKALICGDVGIGAMEEVGKIANAARATLMDNGTF